MLSEPTTVKELHEKYREALAAALPGRDEDQKAVDNCLDIAELDIIPRVWGDERRFRVVIDGHPLWAVIDAQDAAQQLAFALIGHPAETVALRPADDEEVRVFATHGAEGLAELDRRRAEHERAIAHETAAALTAALEMQP